MITDLHGVTGRDIMDHLIAGERNPKTLAQLARTRARRKITELEEALEGAEFFADEHATLLKTMLERIDRVNAEIDELTAVIERLLAPRPPADRSPRRQARRPRLRSDPVPHTLTTAGCRPRVHPPAWDSLTTQPGRLLQV